MSATEKMPEKTPRGRGAVGLIAGHAARRGIHRGGVVANASSLFGSTVVTSLLGFVFWIVAAHTFSRTAVGAGGAAISAMQLVAMASMLGLGTLLIGELSRSAVEHPGRLITTALLTSTIAGVGGGLAFAIGARTLSSSDMIPNGIAGLALFVITVALSGALLVLDSATVGLSRASWQFWRNLAFSVLKLAALPLVLALGLDNAAGLILSWLLGAALSIVVIAVLAERSEVRLIAAPRRELIGGYGGTALTHHWLNLSSGAPRLILPVLVATYLTLATNAAFYSALLLIGFPYIVAIHFGNALFGVASGDYGALERELRRTIKVCTAVAAIALVIFGAGGHLLLSMFGSGYTMASLPLAILAVGTFPNAVRAQYIAVCRVNGDLGRCAIVSCLGSGIEILLPLVALMAGGGLVLVSSAWVAAMFLEAAVLWPPVAFAAHLSDGYLPAIRWVAPLTFGRSN